MVNLVSTFQKHKRQRSLISLICTPFGLFIAILLFMAANFTIYNITEDYVIQEVYIRHPEVYHSPEAFILNYKEMERKFKVYVYPDGEKDAFYDTPRSLVGKYASEGYFFKNIRESRFITNDPDKAHLFFIPISCHHLRSKVSSYDDMAVAVRDYVENLISRYPYWNRSLGADHFFVTCHDIGLMATERVPPLAQNSIRVVCSPNDDVYLKPGFIPGKDILMPRIRQPFAESFAHSAEGSDLENRVTLGFWAGRNDSDLRGSLIRMWGKDTELDIQSNRVNKSSAGYKEKLYRSKFCVCPAGAEINTFCMADSIHYGCVPVILADQHLLPFGDILDWRKFSVVLYEKDVHNLSYILRDIKDAHYITLHGNVNDVQKHFKWNSPPKKYDAFHMVVYELWLRCHVVKH